MVRRRYQLAARDAALEDTELHAALVERRKEGVR
jgi:hypothetical protein